MQKFITLGTEDDEIHLTFTSKIIDPGYQVEFDDVDEGCINDVYVTDHFGTKIHIKGCATVNLDENFLSLHLMTGTLEHKNTLHAIFAALSDYADTLKAEIMQAERSLPPSNKTQLSGCGVHQFYVD